MRDSGEAALLAVVGAAARAAAAGEAGGLAGHEVAAA